MFSLRRAMHLNFPNRCYDALPLTMHQSYECIRNPVAMKIVDAQACIRENVTTRLLELDSFADTG